MSGSAAPTGTSASAIRTKAQNDLLVARSGNLFDAAFGGVTADAVTDSALLGTELAGSAASNTPFPDTFAAFPTSSLGLQLRTIARLVGRAPPSV